MWNCNGTRSNVSSYICRNSAQHHQSFWYEMRRRTETGRRFGESHASTYFSTRLSLSASILRRKLRSNCIHLACTLLFITAYSTGGLAKEISRSGNKTNSLTQFCCICLLTDKISAEAKEVHEAFSHETQKQIPDCATFALNFSTDVIIPCPPKYVGCQIQIHGAHESRFCARLPLNECKRANKMELCYCKICNAKRPHHSLITAESERESTIVWQSSETDDEDLLQQPYNHLGKMQNDMEDVGSGAWEPPPGVILLETTTPKPTLIPNLRPDSRTTTSFSTNGAGNFCISVILWLLVSAIFVLIVV